MVHQALISVTYLFGKDVGKRLDQILHAIFALRSWENAVVSGNTHTCVGLDITTTVGNASE